MIHFKTNIGEQYSCAYMNRPKIVRAFSHLGLSCFRAGKDAFSNSQKSFMKIEAGSSSMAVQVVEFSNGGYKVRKVFA